MVIVKIFKKVTQKHSMKGSHAHTQKPRNISCLNGDTHTELSEIVFVLPRTRCYQKGAHLKPL